MTPNYRIAREFLWVCVDALETEIQSRVRAIGISPVVCLAAPRRQHHFCVQGGNCWPGCLVQRLQEWVVVKG